MSPNAITFVSMLRPRALKNAIVMGANFEHSLLYLWLTRIQGMTLQVHDRLRWGCEAFLPSGRKLQLQYIWENKKYSKLLRDKDDNFAKEASLSDATLATEHFLTVPNGDTREARRKWSWERSLNRTPAASTAYHDARNIYFGAALKRKPNLCN